MHSLRAGTGAAVISVKYSAMLLSGLMALAAWSSGCGTPGKSKQQIAVPDPVVDGNVQVACTVACDANANCDHATVFVSACEKSQPGLCYQVTPADDAEAKGNTYVVSVDSAGTGDVIEGAKCIKASKGDDKLPVDLLFVIDTTSSMSQEIAGVVASINSFVDELAARGVSARIGGIAFGDKAPLPNCTAPKTPFSPFTAVFGAGTEGDASSFNHWVLGLGAGYCGDGGGDGPENALDAIEFAMGNDPDATDKFPATSFMWRPTALHVMVVITDVAQHEKADMKNIAHFDFAEVKAHVAGVADVHAVAPNFGCYNTPAAGCLCDLTTTCDADCACDTQCPTPGCATDIKIGTCDDKLALCDIDCQGYPLGSGCDLTVNRCDPASQEDPTTPCADDVDCKGGVTPGTSTVRRCRKTPQTPSVDIGELTIATGGAFTPLPVDGNIDLNKLPLTGVLVETSMCQLQIPKNATSLRCVYIDDEGRKGEATIAIK